MLVQAKTSGRAMVKSLKALSVLVLVLLLSAVSARFTEEFKPNKDGNAKAITPGLWKQIGDIMQGGRGTDETRYAMRLNPEKPRTAETAVLRWGGTSIRLMDCHAVVVAANLPF